MAKKKSLQAQALKAKKLAKKEIAKAKVKLLEAERKVEAFAKKDPKKALLIAAAVGAAVGAGVAVALNRMRRK